MDELLIWWDGGLNVDKKFRSVFDQYNSMNLSFGTIANGVKVQLDWITQRIFHYEVVEFVQEGRLLSLPVSAPVDVDFDSRPGHTQNRIDWNLLV